MKDTGYTNPIRSMERKLAPDFASREFRDPGLRTTRQSAGLGSLKHTMPHLQRSLKLQGGGGLHNPVGEIAAASHPNLYNPDPEFRQFMQLASQPAFTARDLMHAPSNRAEFVYDEGGEVAPDEEGHAPDMGEVQSPDDQMSAPDQQERQIVLNAMAALDGQSPDPGADLQAFIKAFGPRALKDLQQLVEQQHQTQGGSDGSEEEAEEEAEGEPEGGQGDQEEQEGQEGQDPELAQAGGGLLHGKGTGQSDEIEGTTPSGRPVLLSDGEYVIDAPTVAALGDGSTKAGARRLDDLRKQIRKSSYGHDKQAKPMRKDKGGGVTVVLK